MKEFGTVGLSPRGSATGSGVRDSQAQAPSAANTVGEAATLRQVAHVGRLPGIALMSWSAAGRVRSRRGGGRCRGAAGCPAPRQPVRFPRCARIHDRYPAISRLIEVVGENHPQASSLQAAAPAPALDGRVERVVGSSASNSSGAHDSASRSSRAGATRPRVRVAMLGRRSAEGIRTRSSN
jgi:hypothetical protein